MEELVNILDENGNVIIGLINPNEIPAKYSENETENTGKVLTDYGEIIYIDYAVLTEDEGIQHIDDCYCCYLSDNWYLSDDDFVLYNGEHRVHQDALEVYDLVRCYIGECYIDRDEAIYCVDIEDWVYEDYAVYCEADDNYYYDANEMPGEYSKDTICEYHCSPDAEDLNKGKSPYSVGFEIEKTDFNGCTEVGDEIGDYEIFKGFETDSSCGVEAITNILPLASNKEIESYVFDMMEDAGDVISSDTDNSCGGHITISAEGYTSSELYDKIRSSMGVIYALWRYRIKNQYCKKNTSLKKENNDKYCPLNLKSNGCVEIRLPNRVENVKQLMFRYKLIAIIVEHSLTTHHTFDQLLRKLAPILDVMYEGNKTKIEQINKLSRSFWKYLVTDVVTEDIAEFLDK